MLGVLLLLKRRNGLKQGGCSDGDDNDDVDDDGEFAFYGAASGKTFASLALLEVSNGERVSTSSTCRSASRTLNSPNRNRKTMLKSAATWRSKCKTVQRLRLTSDLTLISKSYILYAATQ